MYFCSVLLGLVGHGGAPGPLPRLGGELRLTCVHAIDATSLSNANRFFLGLGLGGVHLSRPAGDELLEPLPGRLGRPPLAVDLHPIHLVGLDEAPII